MYCNQKMRFLTLALAAVLAAGCDSGTEPSGLIDANGISSGVDATYAPVQASADASFVLSDFVSTMLGGEFSFQREPIQTPVRTRSAPGIRPLARQGFVEAEVEIPVEMLGKTFVYDPVEETWVVDESRTEAPENGVRVTWYAIDDTGLVIEPLDERGYVDLTDEDDATFERLGVVIVRTAGGAVTLADFTHAYASSEAGLAWTEALEFDGTFSDGSASVDIDIALDASGEGDGSEVYVWDLAFVGPQASYDWLLDGGYDEFGTFEDDLLVTIVRSGVQTVLDLAITGDDLEESGSGTLRHAGTAIANVLLSDGDYTFTKPGGGSFTAQQENQLFLVMSTMVLYGPLVLLTMPLLFAGI